MSSSRDIRLRFRVQQFGVFVFFQATHFTTACVATECRALWSPYVWRSLVLRQRRVLKLFVLSYPAMSTLVDGARMV